MKDITYWRNPATGLIEGIRPDGTVLSAQKNLDAPFDLASKAGFKELVSPTGEVTWIQEDLELKKVHSWKYNHMIGSVIAGEVANGAAISTLHKKFDWCPPYAIIARWKKMFPEFKEMLDDALKDRALLRFEEVIEIADETGRRLQGTEDELGGAKLRIDARKYSAELDDKEAYGSKKTDRDVGPVQILIQTGIQREVPAVVDVKKVGPSGGE